MKKIFLITLLATVANLAMASETVEINKAKYTKYSDSEVRNYIVKMNSIRPDMTVDQVVSILGKPIREQSVSASPPQRILVYPLAIVVSMYRNSRSHEWLVTAPPLYGNPLCQREDGAPQKNSIGADATEYPSINCIPQKFAGKPEAKREPASAAAPASTGKWASIDENRHVKLYYDPSSVETIGPRTMSVSILRSFADPEGEGRYQYRSEVSQIIISCNDLTWGQKSARTFSDEMATGRVIYATEKPKDNPEMQRIPSEDSYPYYVGKKICKK